jgi:hypothetical protein
MKAALCFIISYDHVLNKEHLWRQWIDFNKDIINVYFFYKDYSKIESQWIKDHALPPSYICGTTYTNNVGAYLALMMFALKHDQTNEWFCFLTETCCPLVSPQYFRQMFFKHNKQTIMQWRPAWWNMSFHKRANLALLPKYLQLANDPYFIFNRTDAVGFLQIFHAQPDFMRIICEGGIANESLFAITLNIRSSLSAVISEATHVTDWDRMTSATSPHLFHAEGDLNQDQKFLESQTNERKFKFFVRKIATNYPDDILRYFMYKKHKKVDVGVRWKPNWLSIALLLFSLLLLYQICTGVTKFYFL